MMTFNTSDQTMQPYTASRAICVTMVAYRFDFWKTEVLFFEELSDLVVAITSGSPAIASSCASYFNSLIKLQTKQGYDKKVSDQHYTTTKTVLTLRTTPQLSDEKRKLTYFAKNSPSLLCGTPALRARILPFWSTVSQHRPNKELKFTPNEITYLTNT